jgi:hypothetical protein
LFPLFLQLVSLLGFAHHFHAGHADEESLKGLIEDIRMKELLALLTPDHIHYFYLLLWHLQLHGGFLLLEGLKLREGVSFRQRMRFLDE